VRTGRRTAVLALAVIASITVAAAALFAQGFGRSRRSGPEYGVQGNTPYDGRYTFVRLRYEESCLGSYGRGGGGGCPHWYHDYPEGEVHFSKILEELSLVRVRTDGSNILTLDDPELFNYPIAYMAEPGFWAVSDSEAASFRQYLLKGGFAIFDDFRAYDWDNLKEQMRRVLPDGVWMQLDGTSAVFHSFFEIDDPMSLIPPYNAELAPSYWGIFEDNDPQKRLMLIANVNNDISEYWEFSGTGLYVVDLSNEAYKFGINYVMYGLTH
jgi:hypothetical protein